MKLLGGFTDSLASISREPAPCMQCGGITRITRGICASCLLAAGIDGEEDEEVSREAFERVLDEAAVSDREWRLGQYEILGEIGRGGMGVIYRARQRHSRRIVAVKRVLSYQAGSYETLTRFRREAEAAASLDHPNILPIYEVSETEEGIPYFSMKYATGGCLRGAAAVLHEDPRGCVLLLMKVARAVSYAHEQGILHRDLQPGNILLDSRGEPMVSDFGLAKWLDGSNDLTRTITAFGTPGFIAPEQADGKTEKLTPAADIYSLGAILFYLLTRRPPFIGPSALSVVRQAADVAAPRLRTMVRGIDRDLETILERCLEREPALRYPSAAALADDLQRWGEGRPIAARPVLPSTRLWRWTRRNPAFSAVAAGCAALALTVLLLLKSGSATADQMLPPDKSVAVLPFENISRDAANDYFADGMHEDVLAHLAKVSDLKVISRSSVREFAPEEPRNLRAIGRALGVRHILEGSVRRAGDWVRISVRLTDSTSGQQLWAQQYDRDLHDIFAIQQAIASQIVDHLQAQLSPTEEETISKRPAIDLTAYDLYLRAREIAHQAAVGTPERIEKQVQLLQAAIEREPTFVPALCLLARTHVQAYWENHDHTPARLEAAWRALEQAARIQPSSGEVHLTRGIILYWGSRSYLPARTELAIAQRLLPNEANVPYFLGLIARRQGDWAASTRHFEQAKAIDPRNELIVMDLVRANYNALKRYADAAAVADGALRWKPNAFQFQLLRAKVDLMSHGDLRRLKKVLWDAVADDAEPEHLALERVEYALAMRDYALAEEALRSHPLPTFRWDGYLTPAVWFAALIAEGRGEVENARGLFREARSLLEDVAARRPDDAKVHIVLGEVLAHLGDREAALRAGEAALAARPVDRDFVDGPFLLGRFAAICAQLGEKERALQVLEQALPLPYALNYGPLRTESCWDSLRGDPRFESILARLKPSSDLP